jgi:glycosyltransferase involved in cell wall biosynthesis
MCPDEIRPLIAEFHPFAEFSEYPALLAGLNLDIAVAPLAQIPFNQGKSNLRLLEYGVLGIPVVCTDIDPYRDSPACCVPNTASAWVQALRERIHDADGREREGDNLRRWVHQGYLLENHMDQWLAAHLPSRK